MIGKKSCIIKWEPDCNKWAVTTWNESKQEWILRNGFPVNGVNVDLGCFFVQDDLFEEIRKWREDGYDVFIKI